jgi:hypothetical protein
VPQGLRRTIILTFLAVVAGLAALGFLSRQLAKTQPPEPELPRYPDNQLLKFYRVENTGAQLLLYRVPLDYPSMKVLEFYEKRLGELGYRPDPPEATPRWQVKEVKKDSRKLVLARNWIGPQKLHVLQLQISTTEKLTRDAATGRLISSEVAPGLLVSVSLSRKVVYGRPPAKTRVR